MSEWTRVDSTEETDPMFYHREERNPRPIPRLTAMAFLRHASWEKKWGPRSMDSHNTRPWPPRVGFLHRDWNILVDVQDSISSESLRAPG